jgi:hypothetical protein
MSSNRRVLFLLFVFALLVSIPILHAGFVVSDDAQDSSVRGLLQILHLNVWQYAWAQNVNLSLGQGRVYIFAFADLPIFYYFPDPFATQVVRLIFIWASLITAAWFVRCLTKNKQVALSLVLVIPLFWSIRNFGDPLVSYGAALSLLTLFMMLSLGAYLQFCERKNSVWYVSSVLAYVASLLIYEPGITSLFCLLVLAWLQRRSLKQFLIHMSPYLVVTFLYGIVWMVVRQHTVVYDGVAIGHFDFAVIKPFLYQLTAPLPLDYGLLSGHFFKWIVLTQFFSNPYSVCFLVVLAIVSYILGRALFPQIQLTHKQSKALLLLALPLCVVPAVLIALTAKYREILAWGLAYLPIYVEYIGVGFLLLVLLNKIKHKQQPRWAILFSLLICLSFIFNTYNVNRLNEQFKYPRALQVEAIQHGLLKDLPKNSLILMRETWGIPAFFEQNGQVQVQTQFLSANLTDLKPSQQAIFVLLTNNKPLTSEGTVLLGRVISLEYNTVNNVSRVSGIVFSQTREFSSFGQIQKMAMLPREQHVAVSWQCVPHWVVPCFSQPVAKEFS